MAPRKSSAVAAARVLRANFTSKLNTIPYQRGEDLGLGIYGRIRMLRFELFFSFFDFHFY